MEGTPNREGQGQALPCKAGEETGARIDRPEPPREREPRPGAEPRPQQVGRQKRKRLLHTGVQFPEQTAASVRAPMAAPIAAGLLDSRTIVFHSPTIVFFYNAMCKNLHTGKFASLADDQVL